jgi:hypothetical protein
MSRANRKYIPAAVGALAVVAVLLYLYAGHETPAGQPPLASLTPDTLSQFETAFDSAKSDVRVVLFLSPT